MTTLTILAPLDGWCAPLEEVPDPVFAGRMLGDGLAIDPLRGRVIAPCGGEIVTVAAGGHAVSVRNGSGVEVLVHVGIDTVQLGGRGFEILVRTGQTVHEGDELIRFDLDAVARTAKSLMTPVVLTPLEGLEILSRRPPGLVRAGEKLFEVRGVPTRPASAADSAAPAAMRAITVGLRHGLHARPAALLAQRLRDLQAEVAIEAHGKRANARSIVAIMALGVGHGDEISVRASGADAHAALAAVVAGLEEALRAEARAGHAAATPAPAAEAGAARPGLAPSRARPASGPPPLAAIAVADGELTGVIAVAGFAVGRAARIERPEIAVAEAGAGRDRESAELERARATVRARLTRIAAVGGGARREIVGAHVEFLDDPLLNEAAQELIDAGRSAGFAWRTAVRRSIADLEALADERLRERADDLLDVESHVLLALAGEARPLNLSLPEGAVLLADELLPSELVAIDRGRLAAICLGGGGATSHVAILAAAMDVPMLVGVGSALRQVAEGTTVIVDAERGRLHVAPSAADIAAAETTTLQRRSDRALERAAAQRECRTRDGTRIEVYANIGSTADATAAVANGAEGCGLLRTEFLFIDRESAPDESEQLAAYQAVADALGGRPLVLRLMDIGGDKPLPYLPLPPEENPALGLRGIRTAFWRPDLLRTQLRAALRVVPEGVVRLLLPMVTDAAEVRAVRALVDEICAELGDRPPVQIGAMIETPAAALTATLIARDAEFLSIGSNDLTQYTLAMDRGHAELARSIDALHPAVLKLVSAAAASGTAAGRPVAVCGGIAADPLAVPLLIGLGVRELSVVPAAVPALKRQLRSLDLGECVTLAGRCLDLESAAAVRSLTAQAQTPSGATP